MGRYSRKDMIEFAKFAKSYQSSRNVDEAYAAYLGGARQVTFKTSLYQKICRANIVYLNGKTIKDKFKKEEITDISLIDDINNFIVELWDDKEKRLYLTSK